MKKDESIIPEFFWVNNDNTKDIRIFDGNCTYTFPRHKRTIQVSPLLTITIKKEDSNGM